MSSKIRIRSKRYRGRGRPRKSDFDDMTFHSFLKEARHQRERKTVKVFNSAFSTSPPDETFLFSKNH